MILLFMLILDLTATYLESVPENFFLLSLDSEADLKSYD